MEEEIIKDKEVTLDIHIKEMEDDQDKKDEKKTKSMRKQPKKQAKKVEKAKTSNLENDKDVQSAKEEPVSEDKENKKEIDLYSEKKEIIKVENLTKDYGNGRGIFDISFTINKGEILTFS